MVMNVEKHKSILAIVSDIFFSVQVDETAKRLGYRVDYAKSEQEVSEKLALHPDLIILDLADEGVQWDNMIQDAKTRGNPAPVLAFGHHMDLEVRDRALKAGADAVVSNAVFSKDLQRLVEKYVKK
ncbi:MAG: response regulator [Dehalococcoidia bacterium]|nr:response regulator [Dehalococcoidia bacterium]